MLCSLLIIVTLLPLAFGDISSDTAALLAFSTAIPHGRKLNWNAASPICTSWTGVNCSEDGSSVIGLRLPGIGLTGPIPSNTIGKLNGLRVLSFRANRLSGGLPSDILSLPSLRYVFLQNNNFSGEIPSSLPPQLAILDLSFNSLTGSIPLTFQNLSHLTALSLQNNSLSGPIPDLDLPHLKRLNLSYNRFNGSIPSSLNEFPNSSFIGNSLCGPPLESCSPISPPSTPSTPLPPTGRETSTKKLSLGAIIAIAVGGAVLLFLVALILFLCCFKRKQNEEGAAPKIKSSGVGRTEKPSEEFGSGVQEPEKNKLVFFEGCSYNFDLEDLLRASAEVLGKGSFGTAYKAVLEESTTVVVKRLKEVIVGKKDFEQQMEVVGRVGQHPNIVPLRAYYYSKDEKLLVYDYYPNGSLASLLHGTLSFSLRFPSFHWPNARTLLLLANYNITPSDWNRKQDDFRKNSPRLGFTSQDLPRCCTRGCTCARGRGSKVHAREHKVLERPPQRRSRRLRLRLWPRPTHELPGHRVSASRVQGPGGRRDSEAHSQVGRVQFRSDPPRDAHGQAADPVPDTRRHRRPAAVGAVGRPRGVDG